MTLPLCVMIITSDSSVTCSVATTYPLRSVVFMLTTPLPPREVMRYSRSEEHTSELQSQSNLVCRLLLETHILWTSCSNREPDDEHRRIMVDHLEVAH